MSKNARIVTWESISVRIHVPTFSPKNVCNAVLPRTPPTPRVGREITEVHYFQVRRSMSGVTVAKEVSRLGWQEPSIRKYAKRDYVIVLEAW